MTDDLFAAANLSWFDMPDTDDYADSISLFSSVRIRRNIRKFAFPGRCRSFELYDAAALILGSLGRDEQWNECDLRMVDKLDRMSRALLLEQRMITPLLAKGGAGRFFLRNASGSLSCMINEEDHIVVTVTNGGLNLLSAADEISKLEASMDMDMAKDSVLGYLTANPNCAGSGMKACAVLHLPALDALGEMPAVAASMAKDWDKLALYKILSDQENDSGSFYIVMNRTTLSLSEEEIASGVTDGARSLISKEFLAWNRIRNSKSSDISDRLWRAWGLLRHARKLSFSEAISAFSLVKLGSDLGVLPAMSNSEWLRMVITSQRYHLALECRHIIDQDEEPYIRASRFREFIDGRSAAVPRIGCTFQDKEL